MLLLVFVCEVGMFSVQLNRFDKKIAEKIVITDNSFFNEITLQNNAFDRLLSLNRTSFGKPTPFANKRIMHVTSLLMIAYKQRISTV